MFPPSSPALWQLHRLNVSSPDFQDLLSNILYGDEYVRCVPNLGGDDLLWLVDYLDKALDGLDPSTSTFRKCLLELRSICGTRAILPTSYTLPPQLLRTDPFPLASGGYGDVFEGTLDSSKVSIKRVRVYTQDGLQKAAKTICKEAVLWKRLKHPNIVPLLGITVTPFQLVSDWMSGGDLPEYLEKHPDADRLGLLSDVSRGLCYLHSSDVTHGDLKGSNVLVDAHGQARITDFCLATVTANVDSELSALLLRSNTLRWTAPEVMNGGKYSREADIFSLAMVMIEIFSQEIPFSSISSFMAMLAITQGKRPPRPPHSTFTENLWTLMQRCWDDDPHLRPEASEVLKTLLTLDLPAWKQLISYSLSVDERTPLITSIFSDRDEVEVVEHLAGDDAQAFIDVVYEALDYLTPQIRRRCLRSLYRICGRQALLPRSLPIPLSYDPTTTPHCHGGFADVWKGQHNGQVVAAKALRVYQMSDLDRIRKRFCREVMIWRTLCHPNVLPLLGVTMTETRFVMVSEWMTKGNINEFLKTDSNADRLGLLVEVTKGLIYMHEHGIVHGDLKGENVLIDQNGHACVADFSLLTIAADQSILVSSWMEGGTAPWMSPELLDPESFGLVKIRPTKESDCYALGMVVYEVLSGQAPFSPSGPALVIRKVLDGERPGRPEGEGGRLFTDSIWAVLEYCWKPRPCDRVNAKVVLSVLEGNPVAFRPPSDTEGDEETDIDDLSDTMASDSGLSKNSKKGGIADGLVRSVRRIFQVAVRGLRKLWRAMQ